MTYELRLGDVRALLKAMPADSVQCVVTSPPYWGLRDYGMVEVFRAVRRVLRPDGTLWLNMGDCYATGAVKVSEAPGGGEQGARWKGEAIGHRDARRRDHGQPATNGCGEPQTSRTAERSGHEGGQARLSRRGRSHRPSRACMRDGRRVDLRRWIQLAALMLPGRAGAVTQTHINNSAEAKWRVPTVTSSCGDGDNSRHRVGSVVHQPAPGQRCRTQSVLRAREAVPVAIGGSGKRKPGARTPAVVGAHSGIDHPKGGHLVVYTWEEMLRLQGLPPDFLDKKFTPFTVKGKRKAVANGVPLHLGRAIARAVRQATDRQEAFA